MKPISTALLLIALSLAAAANAQSDFTVEATTIEDLKAVFGTVQSVDVIAARVRIGGTVSGLAIDEGAAVRQGDVLARVADPKLSLQLVAIDARLRSLASQKELAEIELDRMTRLRKTGAVSQARLDEAQTNLDVISGNQAAVEADRAVLAEQLAEGAVLAPTDGRVLRVHVTENSVVLPGEAIASIAAERYVLRIELPERHARFIAQGDTVRVGGRGLAPADPESGDPLGNGLIAQVYPEMRNGRVVADVEVAGLGDFFVGERVRVYVTAGVRETIIVPAGFLQQRYGVTYAMVKGEGEVMVQPGQRFDGQAEILSGLRPGDILIHP